MENPYEPPQSSPDLVPLVPVQRSRPTSVSAFGALNIAFGLMGVIFTPLAVLSLFMPQAAGAPSTPMVELTKGETYRAFLIGSSAFRWIASAVLLAAGVGLLRERSWGRKLSIGYGVYALVAAVVVVGANFVFMVMPLLEASNQQNSPPMTMALVVAISSVAAGIAGFIYPILLLIFMTRPRVVAFLDRPRPSDPKFFSFPST